MSKWIEELIKAYKSTRNFFYHPLVKAGCRSLFFTSLLGIGVGAAADTQLGANLFNSMTDLTSSDLFTIALLIFFTGVGGIILGMSSFLTSSVLTNIESHRTIKTLTKKSIRISLMQLLPLWLWLNARAYLTNTEAMGPLISHWYLTIPIILGTSLTFGFIAAISTDFASFNSPTLRAATNTGSLAGALTMFVLTLAISPAHVNYIFMILTTILLPGSYLTGATLFATPFYLTRLAVFLKHKLVGYPEEDGVRTRSHNCLHSTYTKLLSSKLLATIENVAQPAIELSAATIAWHEMAELIAGIMFSDQSEQTASKWQEYNQDANLGYYLGALCFFLIWLHIADTRKSEATANRQESPVLDEETPLINDKSNHESKSDEHFFEI